MEKCLPRTMQPIFLLLFQSPKGSLNKLQNVTNSKITCNIVSEIVL